MNAHLIWGAAVLALAGTSYGLYTALEATKGQVATYQEATKRQNTEAEMKLAAERERVAQLQRALKIAAEMQEKKDAERTSITVRESESLRAVTAPTGRLRDPNADTCGPRGGGGATQAGAPAEDRAGAEPETGGLLSAQLTALLTARLLEADRYNDAFASCKDQALSDRGLPPGPIDPE